MEAFGMGRDSRSMLAVAGQAMPGSRIVSAHTQFQVEGSLATMSLQGAFPAKTNDPALRATVKRDYLSPGRSDSTLPERSPNWSSFYLRDHSRHRHRPTAGVSAGR
jgi:hypothetical protein